MMNHFAIRTAYSTSVRAGGRVPGGAARGTAGRARQAGARLAPVTVAKAVSSVAETDKKTTTQPEAYEKLATSLRDISDLGGAGGRCKLDPGLKAPLVSKVQPNEEKRSFKLNLV